MNIYFGQVKKSLAQSIINDGGKMFKQGKKYYEFCLSMDEDTFRITDGLGRMIPFSPEDIASLAKAADIAADYADPIVHYNEVKDYMLYGESMCV